MNRQITAIAEDLAVLRNEIVQVKSAHAALHQGTVEAGAGTAQSFETQLNRIKRIEKDVNDSLAGLHISPDDRRADSRVLRKDGT